MRALGIGNSKKPSCPINTCPSAEAPQTLRMFFSRALRSVEIAKDSGGIEAFIEEEKFLCEMLQANPRDIDLNTALAINYDYQLQILSGIPDKRAKCISMLQTIRDQGREGLIDPHKKSWLMRARGAFAQSLLPPAA